MSNQNITDNENNNSLEKLSEKEIQAINDSLEKNPKEVIDLIEQSSIMSYEHMMEQMFAGPLPHPDTLKGYGNIDSSFPDRIFKLTEQDQEHRIKMEQYAIKENFKANKLGIFSGLMICILALFGGIFLIYNDKNIEGLVTLVTPLVGLAIAFIRSNKKDDESNLTKKHN